MTTTATDTPQIAATIRTQIGTNALISLGAHHMRSGTIAHTKGQRGLPSLIFKARILPFKKDGQRAQAPRNMFVIVSLTVRDTYVITVSYQARGERVDHYHATDVYAEDLSRIMLALDYDGPTALNPRLAA